MFNKRMNGLFVFALAAGMGLVSAQEAVMPLCAKAGQVKVELQPQPALEATLDVITAEAGGPAWRISFTKSGPERRYIALQASAGDVMAAYKVLEMTAVVKDMTAGVTLRPAVMLFEYTGGAWYRFGLPLVVGAGEGPLRMGFNGLRQAKFSTDSNGVLDWPEVSHFWVGLLADGVGSGKVELREVSFTSKPFVPTGPLDIAVPAVANWSMSIDKAATHTAAMVKDGDVELPTMSFRFPLNRHMFITPAIILPEGEYASYNGLRLTYRAKTPAGINGLLVMLHEGGGSFYTTIPVPASAEWRTIELPFSSFQMASWNKKPSGSTLEVAAITRLTIGCHGVATGDNGEGDFAVKKIELIP